MTDIHRKIGLVEVVAHALWRDEAARAAPNMVKQRSTVEDFRDQSLEVRVKWTRMADVAIEAIFSEATK